MAPPRPARAVTLMHVLFQSKIQARDTLIGAVFLKALDA